LLARRGTQRLAKALRTSGVIMESVADAVGFRHGYKEIIKDLHHLAELVIEEGPQRDLGSRSFSIRARVSRRAGMRRCIAYASRSWFGLQHKPKCR
jgi:hypothetical protein